MAYGSPKRNALTSLLLFLCALSVGVVRLESDVFSSLDGAALTTVQSIRSPALDLVMRGFSMLGEEDFLIFIGASLFWYGERRQGIAYMLTLILSQMVNFQSKAAFSLPRPTPQEAVQLASETSAGFPSNHSQNGIFMFSSLARLTSWGSPLVLVGFCVGVSRMYLGVHYLTDVVGGFLLGAAFFCGLLSLLGLLEAGRLSRLLDTTGKRVALSCLFSALVFLFGQEYEFRYKVSPLAAGLFIALSISTTRWRFLSRGTFVAAVALAGMGAVAVRVGLKALLPESVAFDMARYVILGAYVAFVPLLFVRTRLAQACPKEG